jgi:hypothetical protein
VEPLTASDNFRISLFLAEAWAAASQGDHKILAKVFEASNSTSPSLPLSATDSLTISPKPKTAALCFDRVWGSSLAIPKEVRYWGASLMEAYTAVSLISLPSARQRGLCDSFIPPAALKAWQLPAPASLPAEKDAATDQVSEERLAEITEQFLTNLVTSRLAEFDTDLRKQTKHVKPSALFSLKRLFVEQSLMKFQQASVLTVAKRVVSPVFAQEQDFATEYKEGAHDIITAILRDVALVDEESLEWEQVLEFRKDEKARQHYRQLIHWLDWDCVGKSPALIQEAVAKKLSDYQAALENHGIRTKLGVLATVLSASTLIASGAVVVATAPLALIPLLGAIVPLAGYGVLQVVKSRTDLDDLTRGPNAEVAFIHDVRAIAGHEK